MNPKKLTDNTSLSEKYNFNNLYDNEDNEEEPIPLTYNCINKIETNNKLPIKNNKPYSIAYPTNQILESLTNNIPDKTGISNKYTFSDFTDKNVILPKEEQTEKLSKKKELKNRENLEFFDNCDVEKRVTFSDKIINHSREEFELNTNPRQFPHSEKDVIPSDVYFKPRKGDKTPKCVLTTEKKNEKQINEAELLKCEKVNNQIDQSNVEDKESKREVVRKINYQNDKLEESLNNYNEEQELNIASLKNKDLIFYQNSHNLNHLEKDMLQNHLFEINHKNVPLISIEKVIQEIVTENNTNLNKDKNNVNNKDRRVDFNHATHENNMQVNNQPNNLNLTTPSPQSNLNLCKSSVNKSNQKLSLSNAANKQGSITPNTSHIQPSNNSHNISHLSSNPNDNHFNQYDIQQMTYDLVKEYSHLKINNDEDFMKRMLFDIFKRQTKEERMEKLLENNKVKMNEVERIKTFNRLIEDANRRLEAQENMEAMKNKILEQEMIGMNSGKKITQEEWEEIYMERFLRYKVHQEQWRQDKFVEKTIQEKKKEDEIIGAVKTKKVSQQSIDQSVKRMYDEAVRRKIKLDETIKKKKEENGDENEIKNSNDEDDRDLTPTKFKKTKKQQKYNFMVRSIMLNIIV